MQESQEIGDPTVRIAGRGTLRRESGGEYIPPPGIGTRIEDRFTRLVAATPVALNIARLLGDNRLGNGISNAWMRRKFSETSAGSSTNQEYDSNIARLNYETWRKLPEPGCSLPENYFRSISHLPVEEQVVCMRQLFETINSDNRANSNNTGERRVGLILADFLELYFDTAPEGALLLLVGLANPQIRGDAGLNPQVIHEMVACMTPDQRAKIFVALREMANKKKIILGDLTTDPVKILLNMVTANYNVHTSGGARYAGLNLGAEEAITARTDYFDQLKPDGALGAIL